MHPETTAADSLRPRLGAMTRQILARVDHPQLPIEPFGYVTPSPVEWTVTIGRRCRDSDNLDWIRRSIREHLAHDAGRRANYKPIRCAVSLPASPLIRSKTSCQRCAEVAAAVRIWFDRQHSVIDSEQARVWPTKFSDCRSHCTRWAVRPFASGQQWQWH
jgi:hypothetical protein